MMVRALLLCLPDGLRRAHAKALGGLVFGQDDAVAALGVAAHRRGDGFQLRVGEQLHRAVKAVAVAVIDDPVHGGSPLWG